MTLSPLSTLSLSNTRTFRMAAASLVYDSEGASADAVVLEDGRQFFANAVVSATGAWMRELMPVPMVPHKGQMMSLREPEGGRSTGAPKQGGGGGIGLTRVFFAEGCYIIPKRDGRIVVGSTVEASVCCHCRCHCHCPCHCLAILNTPSSRLRVVGLHPTNVGVGEDGYTCVLVLVLGGKVSTWA